MCFRAEKELVQQWVPTSNQGSRATLSGVASSGIKRRAVLHAGWAVPVVVAVTAAPAMALSQPVFIDIGQRVVQVPGPVDPGKEFGYHMVVVFHSDFSGHRAHRQPEHRARTPTTGHHAEHLRRSPRATPRSAFDVFSSDSANQSAVITYTFTPTGGTAETFSQTVTFPSFNPCKK